MDEGRFIEIRQVHQIFGEGETGYYALADINLNIARGEFVTLIGHSGCGKSTLLNLVAGFFPPTHGSIAVGGVGVKNPGLDRAVVFQSHSLLPWLSVLENVQLAVDAVHAGKDTPFRREQAMRYVEMVHLNAHLHKKPGELSGGMRQRVVIARAFATQPKVLLLDEPFGALDVLTRGSMQDELLDLWETNRKTVLMITHDVDEAVFLSDRIIVLSNGPKSTVAKVVDVDIPRPRTRGRVLDHPRYDAIRKEVLHYLIETSRTLVA